MVWSRVAPRKQLSVPLLELSAALSGAQLAAMLKAEITLPIRQVVYWSDSTTVLTWLWSESCWYKVFVGTRIAEIQDLTEVMDWRYVSSQNNPTDDVTQGRTLQELTQPHRWRQGRPFLQLSESQWPIPPALPSSLKLATESNKLKASALCFSVSTKSNPSLWDPAQH